MMTPLYITIMITLKNKTKSSNIGNGFALTKMNHWPEKMAVVLRLLFPGALNRTTLFWSGGFRSGWDPYHI